jgi:hypothetical protein
VGTLILVLKLRWISLRLAVALTGTAFVFLHCLAIEEVTGPTVGRAGRPDPTLLPVAALQAPNVSAYTALNVPSRAAGFSYNDPVTGVKIWKVTSSTVPTANSGAGHDYGDGGNQVSRGWGPNNNTHTILIRGDGMSYYLVDFTRGTGFSNYRLLTVQPLRDLCASFSSVASQPRILYILTGAQLVRYNTATMRTENTGHFPLAVKQFGWLHQDMHDVWFTGLLDDNQTVWAWNSQTNQLLTHNEAWTNEPRLERNGGYVALTSGSNPSTVRLWDLSKNTLGSVQHVDYFSHLASLRSSWVATNPGLAAPFAQDRYSVTADSLVRTQILRQSPGSEVNNSGNWIQTDAELGGDLNRQWLYVSGVDEAQLWASSLLWQRAVGVERSDGSEQRLLLHHYTHAPGYWDNPWAHPSPDGKVVIFNSNMNGSGRYDLFIAEVPLR